MIPTSNLRRGFVLFSAVLVCLLLWLSTSFLLIANEERHDSLNLTNFLETNTLLRKASMALAEERSATYWLTGIDGLFFAAESLIEPRQTTDDYLQIVTARLVENINNRQYATKLTFQPAHLTTLLDDFTAQTALLNEQRNRLAQDLKYPAEQRDKSLQLEVLEFYRELIEALEVLRYGTKYISSNTSRDTSNIIAVSDATWNIALSNKLLTGIFEGYISSGNNSPVVPIDQATALHSQIEQSLQTINRVDAYSSIDPTLHTYADELKEWHSTNYSIPARRILIALTNGVNAPYTGYDWIQAASTLDEHTQKMLDRADELNREDVVQMQGRAHRNLLIDSILVTACILLVLVAYWIIRRMHHQATHDDMTGLPNRRLFKSLCDEKIDNTGTSKLQPTTLLKLDVHNFKGVNDSFGQVAGDRLLQIVANRLQEKVGPATPTSRLGVDEYALLLANTDSTSARAIADDLATVLSATYKIDGQSIHLNMCIGYASFPEHAKSSEELRKSADLALYEAKQTGPGSVQPYRKAFGKAFHDRQQVESELSLAIERNEFELHYQPQFDLANSVVDGVEALIRWNHPSRGCLSPFHFITVAEEAGMLPEIGRWVINEAARQAALWHNDIGLQLRVSVNVSAHQFLHGDLVATIQSALEREQLNPSAFEVEITESVAMDEMEMVISKLDAIQALGIRIALDDFGTGYSSLSYLQDLPLDTLKIDRAFITKIDSDNRTPRLLLESITNMAKLLQFHTVAEGVETDRQLDIVRALGIDKVQGYYYSKPISAAQIPADVQAIEQTHGSGMRRAA